MSPHKQQKNPLLMVPKEDYNDPSGTGVQILHKRGGKSPKNML